MSRQYVCAGCGLEKTATNPGPLRKFCADCRPAENRRRYREEWFPRYKAKDPERDRLRHARWNRRQPSA